MTYSHENLQDIMIVETGWPAMCDTTATPLSEAMIPADIKGQMTWMEEIVAILNSVNSRYSGKVLGLLYWEPGWTENPTLDSPCPVRSSMSLKPAS